MLKRTALFLIFSALPAFADLTVSFREGAPKDRFTLTNSGHCALPELSVTLDLGTSPSGLIFDVTRSGAGVEVFQPFKLVAGGDHLRATPEVLDGDTAIQLDLKELGIGQQLAFTIDVDDTGGGREITVSGSEIAGATVQVTTNQTSTTATFDPSATAIVPLAACTS